MSGEATAVLTASRNVPLAMSGSGTAALTVSLPDVVVGMIVRNKASIETLTFQAAPRGRAESGFDRPNPGSARSDYGERAYGGELDRRGLGRARALRTRLL